jgi:hypothetical protein
MRCVERRKTAAAWPIARKAGQPIRVASPPEGLCTQQDQLSTGRLSACAKLENSAGLARVRAGRYRADANSNSEITFAAWNPHLIDAPVRSGSRAVHAEPPDRNEAVTRCSIGPRPSGIMSLLMGSMYSAPTYHTMLIEPPHAFRVLPHTSPLRYPRPSHREMVQSDQGLRFRLTR